MVLTGLMVVAGRQERIALVQSEPCVEAAATMEQQVRAATAALERRWRAAVAEVVKGEMAAKAVTAAEERVEATLWDHGKHEAPRGLLDELGVVALALPLLLLLLLLLSDGLVSMQPLLPPLMQDLLAEPAIAQVLLHGRRRVQRS